MDNAMQALLQMEEPLHEAIALADLVQASAGSDSIIDQESVSRGADMLFIRLTQIKQIIDDALCDQQEEVTK